MSNLPPNPYNEFSGPPQMNANTGPYAFSHNQPVGQVPLSQLPPGYGAIKQDANSNSPLHATSVPQNSALQNVNNYSQSASSSPAFNQPGMMSPVQHGVQSSPSRPPMTAAPSSLSNPLKPQAPLSSSSPRTVSHTNPSPTPYPPSYHPHQHQINDNAPPLIPSSQNQPLVNGPPMSQPGPLLNQRPGSSGSYSSLPGSKPPVSSSYGPGNSNAPYGPQSGVTNKPPGPPLTSQPHMPFSTPPLTGPPRHSPAVHASTVSGPPAGTSGFSGRQTGPYVGPPQQVVMNGPHAPGSRSMPPSSEALIGPPSAGGGGIPSGPIGPTSAVAMMPPLSAPPTQSYPGQFKNGPSDQPMGQPGPSGHMGPPNAYSSHQNQIHGHQVLPTGQQGLPPMGHQMGPPPGPIIHSSGVPKSNMQNRYPQMAQGNYVNSQQQQQMQQNIMKQFPQQYGTQAVTQQMGQLSVTKQGFDQLWGHHMVDLLQCKNILPEYPEDPPEIKLGHQFAEAPNCSPE